MNFSVFFRVFPWQNLPNFDGFSFFSYQNSVLCLRQLQKMGQPQGIAPTGGLYIYAEITKGIVYLSFLFFLHTSQKITKLVLVLTNGKVAFKHFI